MDKNVAVLEIKGSDVVSEEDGGQHTNKNILEKSAACAITIGNSDKLSVGDTVYSIGNPAVLWDFGDERDRFRRGGI